jgi:DNA-binding NarL/FixJ family response regulator
MSKVKILVADDNDMVRRRLVSMLGKEPGMESVAAAENGMQAVELAEKHLPDVVLMDVEMPVMNGVEATRRILASRPETKVIAFSGYLDMDYVREMLRAGASGYVYKSGVGSDIASAIRSAAAGHSCIEEPVTDVLVKDYVELLATGKDLDLTPKERQVSKLSLEGKSNKEIAYKLGMSESTVWTHKQNIRQKLGLPSDADISQYPKRSHLKKT